MEANMNYTKAFDELQTIVADMEEGKISLDELSEKIKRAGLLIHICKEKLTTTEENVNTILTELTTKIEETEED